MRTWCCSMTCSGFAPQTCRCRSSVPTRARRRLTALINSVSLARVGPVVYIIEDAHWIDEVSESMLPSSSPSSANAVDRADHLPPALLCALANAPGAQLISLGPLSDAETAALLEELLGTDSSIAVVGR